MERFAFSADDTLWHNQLCAYFLNLIEICDSFDQLGKLAVILDHLYGPLDPEHSPLFKQVEKTARHLRGLGPVHVNHQGDPCPFCNSTSICECEVPF